MKYDIDLDIATSTKRTQKIYKNEKWQWSRLVEKLKTTVRTPETVADYLKLPKSEQGEIKDVGGFVGGYLEQGRRTRVKHRQLVCLDIDFGTIDIWDAYTLVYSCAAVLYSTHKHTSKTQKYRLLIPLDRKVSPEEYEAIARKIAESLDIEAFDDTTYQSQRMMYWPSTSSNGEYVYKAEDSPILKADDVLAEYEDWKDITSWPTSTRTSKAVSRNIKKQKDPLDKSGIVGAFCKAYDIHVAIEKFIDDYVACEVPDRYTYTRGTTSAGVITYENKFSFSHHATDPASSQLCNAFDLVRLHKFRDLDEDCKAETPANKLPSYIEMCNLASADVKVKKELINERKEVLNDFEDEASSFEEKLVINKQGNVVPNYHNIELILTEDPYFKGKLGYDQLANREVALCDLPWRKVSAGDRTLKDIDDASIRSYLDKTYGIIGKDKIYDNVQVVCHKKTFHPVKQYLEGLTWDGVKRIDTLMIDYFDCKDSEYVRAVTRKTLLGAVTRIYQPGCQFDTMLVLKGEQGCGKSSFFRKLGKSWFTDSIKNIKDKDSLEGLQGVWIVEMGELTAMKKADAETIKSFLSGTVDRFRVAYGRRTANYPRQCIFVATTNESEFLRDKTGNRRFWIVGARKGAKPKKNVFALTEEDFDQFWAEAKALYDTGKESLDLNKELKKQAVIEQETYMVEDPKELIIIEYLNRLLPDNWDTMDIYERQMFLESDKEGSIERTKVCAAEIWCEALGNGNVNKLDQYNTVEINKIIDRLPDWEKQKSPMRFKPYGSKRGYRKIVNVK